GRFGYGSEGLGTEVHRRSCFTLPEAASGFAKAAIAASRLPRGHVSRECSLLSTRENEFGPGSLPLRLEPRPILLFKNEGAPGPMANVLRIRSFASHATVQVWRLSPLVKRITVPPGGPLAQEVLETQAARFNARTMVNKRTGMMDSVSRDGSPSNLS